jgi:hypothetical protein
VADEIELRFRVPERPADAIRSWLAQPPAAVEGFDLIDQAYNALTYETRYLSGTGKVMAAVSLGVFKSMVESIWRLNVAFTPADRSGTQITVVGRASEKTRGQLGELAAGHGGAIGPTMGV